MSKKKMLHVLKVIAWVLSFICYFTIFAGGWWVVLGAMSAIWMTGSTIATFIDERRTDD